ncbi:carbohydrate kinase family protein [Kiritimatiella glycovorans]|uniref:2-dehydro-3-deoxygluconokinase n=1 Tax=Kiritimatiella glycovorans TaxID=1307763 RepID=A0A0G3EI42_9BACT|nr:PfkB family carbohydrate kinase [Kiritimatiella glycovorans]AKJ64485.1 2-dehydro-3-deoxygluconokinase [Kiritimatiella glycovorans]
MSESLPGVVVAGLTCLDLAPKFRAETGNDMATLFRPGKLIPMDDCHLSLGGPVPNTGIGLAKLGFDVSLCGKTGDDVLSTTLRAILGEERSRSMTLDPEGTSSYTVVLAVPGRDRIFLHHEGVNATFGAEDIDWSAVESAGLFHLGYPPAMKRLYRDDGAELAVIMRRAKELGATTSLDMSLPAAGTEAGELDWTSVLRNVLPHVDLFLPSIEELAYMLDRDLFHRRESEAEDGDPVRAYQPDDYGALSDSALEWGAAAVTLKSGECGFYLRTAGADRWANLGRVRPGDTRAWSGRELWGPSYRADPVVSATGSGDSSIAGFLSAFMRGFGPEEAVQAANIVGWQNVRAMDALSGLEAWPATLQYMEDHTRPRNPLELDPASWSWSERHQIFHGPHDQETR